MGRACSGEGGEVALGRLAGPWGALGVLGLGAVLAGARICMGGGGFCTSLCKHRACGLCQLLNVAVLGIHDLG